MKRITAAGRKLRNASPAISLTVLEINATSKSRFSASLSRTKKDRFMSRFLVRGMEFWRFAVPCAVSLLQIPSEPRIDQSGRIAIELQRVFETTAS